MKIDILNIEGKSTGKSIELEDAVFAIEPNDHVLYLATKLYLANQRQGTHKTKERGEVAGSTKKLHKQKGTGGSRKGSIKNPVYGNGRTFGPRPRNYSFKLNAKVKKLATKSAIAYKSKESSIIVLEDFNYNEPKTKAFISTLTNLNLINDKSIFVMPTENKNVILSSRNIPNALTVRATDLTTYDIMNCDKLVLTESAVSILTERLK
jgi:large subunit ribosomal protein L4